jgi:hypothetical protein
MARISVKLSTGIGITATPPPELLLFLPPLGALGD